MDGGKARFRSERASPALLRKDSPSSTPERPLDWRSEPLGLGTGVLASRHVGAASRMSVTLLISTGILTLPSSRLLVMNSLALMSPAFAT